MAIESYYTDSLTLCCFVSEATIYRNVHFEARVDREANKAEVRNPSESFCNHHPPNFAASMSARLQKSCFQPVTP